MPLVLVHRDPRKINDDVVIRLSNIIPGIVAKTLSCMATADGFLMESDISVVFQDFGKFDVKERSLQINIFAGNFPGRADGLKEKAQKIQMEIFENTCGRVSGVFSLYDFYVWIFLGESGFAICSAL
jgi:hypothetical protein